MCMHSVLPCKLLIIFAKKKKKCIEFLRFEATDCIRFKYYMYTLSSSLFYFVRCTYSIQLLQGNPGAYLKDI